MFSSAFIDIKCIDLLLGIIIPNVEFVLGLVGATLGTAVCSVAPAWIYLQVAPSSSGERWIAKVNSLFLKWIHLIWFVFLLQVVLVCGLGILILGTVANIYAEEEYSEIHSGTVLPPNLKEIEAKFDVIQQAIPAMANNHNRLGDNSFNDPLSFNRSAFCWDSILAWFPLFFLWLAWQFLKNLHFDHKFFKNRLLPIFAGEGNEKLEFNKDLILPIIENAMINTSQFVLEVAAAVPTTNHSNIPFPKSPDVQSAPPIAVERTR